MHTFPAEPGRLYRLVQRGAPLAPSRAQGHSSGHQAPTPASCSAGVETFERGLRRRSTTSRVAMRDFVGGELPAVGPRSHGTPPFVVRNALLPHTDKVCGATWWACGGLVATPWPSLRRPGPRKAVDKSGPTAMGSTHATVPPMALHKGGERALFASIEHATSRHFAQKTPYRAWRRQLEPRFLQHMLQRHQTRRSLPGRPTLVA